MNISQTQLTSRHFALVAVAVIALLLVVTTNAVRQPASSAGVASLVPNKPATELPATMTLPFSMRAITRYFTDALGQKPSAEQNGSVVFESSATIPREEQFRISVSEAANSITVVFIVHGDYGMNYAREFIEASFFSRAESEQLYELLHQRNGEAVNLGRFVATVTSTTARDTVTVTFRFTPARA